MDRIYTLGVDGKQLLNFRCSERDEREELFIRPLSVCVKIKVKIQRRALQSCRKRGRDGV